jgi:hypothetical protein
MSSNQNVPKSFFAQHAGTRNADEAYRKQFVDTGLVGEKEQLPSGQEGFNLSKMVRRVGQRYAGESRGGTVEQGDKYNAVQLGNPVEGWAKFVEQEYGHRNAFAALSVWNGSVNDLIAQHSQLPTNTGGKNSGQDRLEAGMKDAESVLEKVATTLDHKQVDSGVVQDATPILIDPDFLNTVRSAAPILNWVDIVAQAGFFASYNIISGREEPAGGWSTEAAARNVTSNTGAAFTMPNEQKEMKIWWDLIDVSDYAARAQSSLDFMDLEGTSMQIRMQEYATEMAETIVYGEPVTGTTDGSAKDENAPAGLAELADGANTNYTIDKSTVDLSGDKALFKDIKSEVLSLVNDTAASLGNLGIAVSYDMFDALENEANINVRLREFDQGINFGRDPTGPTTLSIANVPVLPDPNIRAHNYGTGTWTGNVGDVVIFDRMNFQRRALQALSSTPLGKLGLAERTMMFQFETPVSRSQGEFIRFLEDYSIDAL